MATVSVTYFSGQLIDASYNSTVDGYPAEKILTASTGDKAAPPTSLYVAQAKAPINYRMRGYDNTLGHLVYWTANLIDSTGSQYTGSGPLTSIVVLSIIKN